MSALLSSSAPVPLPRPTADSSFRLWRPEGTSGLEAILGQGTPRPFPLHFHDGYEVSLFLSPPGTEHLRLREGVLPLAPAHLIVIPPGEVHATEVRWPSAVTVRALICAPSLVGASVEDMTDGRSSRLPDFDSVCLADEALVRAFLALHRALEDEAEPLEQESRLLTFWSTLIQRHAEQPPRQPRPRRERAAIQRVQRYLREHVDRRVGLDELAAVARMSRFHLCHVFQQEVGMPPHAWHAQLRILRARELLAQGEPIAEVAHEVGLADQSHLNRLFTRAIGMTPGRYVAAVRGRKRGPGTAAASARGARARKLTSR